MRIFSGAKTLDYLKWTVENYCWHGLMDLNTEDLIVLVCDTALFVKYCYLVTQYHILDDTSSASSP
jgi:hypothetical protein